MKRLLLIGLVTVALTSGAASERLLDRVLRGGRILDGTGNPWQYADVGISGDRIAAVARPGSLRGREVIDIAGLYAAPGFIDMMGQSEMQILLNPHMKSKITQGITTEFTGEGGSPAPNSDWQLEEAAPYLKPYGIVMDWHTWDQYRARARKNGFATNFAMMVGATQVRQYAMRNDMREPSPAEMETMKEQVRVAMQSGTFGLSSALVYPPASYSKTDELVALAKVVAEYGGFYATHVRNESDRLKESIDEALDIGRRAGVPVEIWHLKVSGKQNFGRMATVLQQIEEARNGGVDVTADIYPYIAGATSLTSSLPGWVSEGGNAAMLRRLADATQREKIKKEMLTSDPLLENMFLNADSGKKIQITSVKEPASEKYVGKMLEEIAREEGCDEPEAACRLIEQNQGAVGAVYFSQSEEEMQKALQAPFVSFNTDYPAMATDGILGKEHPHPRAYGAFPRIIARYVREKRLIRLEEAIRKMTSLPAHRLGLRKRGLLREGYYADITVFDYDAIQDLATFENPNQYSRGILYVLVNGTPVVERGAITASLPGRFLLSGKDN